MIHPTDDLPDEQDRAPAPPADLGLGDDVIRFFSPDGPLAEGFGRKGRPYESRPQQLEMSLAVAQAMEKGGHLAVEAGTGVGKSFAYLLPAIRMAVKTGRRVVVSTHTIQLQEQLLLKDIPVLQQCLGTEIRAVLVKGRSNYLCRQRLQFALRGAGDLFNAGERIELDRIAAWAETSATGSLQELEPQPAPEVWSQVCAEEGTCSYPSQKAHKDCFLTRARLRMHEAHLLVVNHALFFADLNLRSAGGGLLPDYHVVIFDEAHHLEDVASEHLGIRLSPAMFEHWLRRLQNDAGKGLCAMLQKGEVAHDATRVREAAGRLFDTLHQAGRFQGDDDVQRVLKEPPAVETTLPGLLRQLCRRLSETEQEMPPEGPQGELRSEISSARLKGSALLGTLESFLTQAEEDHVYWMEMEGSRRRQLVLHSAPVEVAPVLREMLYEEVPTVIMTSATLAASGGDLRYFTSRIGLDDAAALSVGSPFNYAEQMRVRVAADMPEPSDEGYTAALARVIPGLVRGSNGAALVLFTSMRTLRDTVGRLRMELESEGFKLWVQGEGVPVRRLLEQFRAHDRSVLFGLASFWTGIDLPGDDLTNVIITRMPFAVPDHPVIKARLERITERGGDAFKDYSLPQAVLKFRQGVGRLIRSATDRGTIVILDSRVGSKWYGKAFLKALPPSPVERFCIADSGKP
ncbi:MAG: helicase C-terminal domain-containing protein [Kiritimatiellia bacterium]